MMYTDLMVKSVIEKFNRKFLALADAVSFGMGSPTNIFFWLLAVAIWFVLGITQQQLFVKDNILPKWFTSNSWNFPLNTITTLAELYIGFLVAAATNRAERELRRLIENIKNTTDKIERLNNQQTQILELLFKYQRK